MSEELQQASFEGWAIVEMMGHRREIGYVKTQAFGQAVLFRVDTPELPEREFILTDPEFTTDIDGKRQWCPAGTRVKRQAIPARTCLIAPSSLYAMNPCTEEAARTAIERSVNRPLILLEVPAGLRLDGPRLEYVYDANVDEDAYEDDTEGCESQA